MAIREDLRYSMKLKALYYLYEKNYTQTQIAKILNISRVTLGKWLDEARAEGMIKFEIVDVKNELSLFHLEDEMKERFHLQDVRLVGTGDLNDSAVMWKIAGAGATYFEQLVRSGMKIGLTWGRTLNAMVGELSINPAIQDLTIYTLVGNAPSSAAFQPNILAQNLLSKYGGSLRILTAPFFCYSAQLCSDIKREPQIASILQETRDLDLTLVGIGEEPAENSGKLGDYPFGSEIIDDLICQHAVGDICGNFFDLSGRLCHTMLQSHCLAINIEELHQHRMVIGVGGGSRKIKSILGALHGGYLDVLITDSQTASAVLALENSLSEGEAAAHPASAPRGPRRI